MIEREDFRVVSWAKAVLCESKIEHSNLSEANQSLRVTAMLCRPEVRVHFSCLCNLEQGAGEGLCPFSINPSSKAFDAVGKNWISSHYFLLLVRWSSFKAFNPGTSCAVTPSMRGEAACTTSFQVIASVVLKLCFQEPPGVPPLMLLIF